MYSYSIYYVVEFSFNENNPSERHSAKESRRTALVAAVAGGWNVQLVILLIGSIGTVFLTCIFSQRTWHMGVSFHAPTACLSCLHLLAVSTGLFFSLSRVTIVT